MKGMGRLEGERTLGREGEGGSVLFVEMMRLLHKHLIQCLRVGHVH